MATYLLSRALTFQGSFVYEASMSEGQQALLSQLLSFHNRLKGFAAMMYELAYGGKPFFPLVTWKYSANFHNNSFPNIVIVTGRPVPPDVDLRNFTSVKNEMKYATKENEANRNARCV